jgi:hypothetical protein
MSKSVVHLAPSPPPLPDVPATDFWNETQWAVYFALIDAAVPSVASESSLENGASQLRISDQEFTQAYTQLQASLLDPPSPEDLKAFLAERPVDDPMFIRNNQRTVCTLPSSEQRKLGAVLSLLRYV